MYIPHLNLIGLSKLLAVIFFIRVDCKLVKAQPSEKFSEVGLPFQLYYQSVGLFW